MATRQEDRTLTKSVKISHEACYVGNVTVGMHVLSGGGGEPSIVISFNTDSAIGLKAGFHGSLTEMRALAASLNEHIVAAEQASA